MVAKRAVLAVAFLISSVHALVAKQEPMQKDYLIKGLEHGILDASAKGEAPGESPDDYFSFLSDEEDLEEEDKDDLEDSFTESDEEAEPEVETKAGSQLKLRKAKQPAAAEASQSLAKVLLPFNGTSVASRVAGADLNLLQVGLSMQSEKKNKKKGTSILDLDASRRLALLAQADEMLKKDLTQHRAKLQHWKANWKANRTWQTHRTLLREGETVSALYGTYVTQELRKNEVAVGYRVAQNGMASGTGSVLATMIQGGDSAAVTQQAATMAITVVSAVAGMVNPLLGLAVTLAASMLSGFLPGADSEAKAMQDLYKQIMEAVSSMISQAILADKLATVQDKIQSIFEELQWIPDLLDQLDNKDIKMSYLLTVQHDLATNARAVFGDCFDNRHSDSCKSWEEAGTLDLALQFAQLHLNLLTILYSKGADYEKDYSPSARRRRSMTDSVTNSITKHDKYQRALRRRRSSNRRRRRSQPVVDKFQTMVAQKAYSLTKDYRCLLDHSYRAFIEKRKTDLQWTKTKYVQCTEAVCRLQSRRRYNAATTGCTEKCCTYDYAIRDSVSGKTWTRSSNWYAPSNKHHSGCLCNTAKDELWNAAIAEINADGEASYRTPIDQLTKTVLSTADWQNSCR